MNFENYPICCIAIIPNFEEYREKERAKLSIKRGIDDPAKFFIDYHTLLS